MKFVPYSALYVDMTFSYIFRHLYTTFKPQDQGFYVRGLESIFLQDPSKENLLITMCVRTALDLVLQSLNFPIGSEVLMSAMNIPDMVKIVRYHGLTVVPVDLNLNNLCPKVDVFKKSITKNTKAVILAWVWGSYNEAEEIYKLCKENNIIIIEDMAEAFFDCKFNGSPQADISLFSFGTIKLNTAFGGALTVIRNNEILYRKANAILEAYPVEKTSFFIKRIIKNIPVMLALNNKYINGYGRELVSKINFEYKEKVVGLVRGFHPTEDFLSTFRIRMPTPMIVFLYLRMKTYDKADFIKGTKRQLEGSNQLTKNGIQVPGSDADKKFYWLFPIIVPDTEFCYKMLNDLGIDAYLGATQLKPIEPPVGSRYQIPTETVQFFEKILYLPIHKNVPIEDINRICREVVRTVEICKAMQANKKKMEKSRL